MINLGTCDLSELTQLNFIIGHAFSDAIEEFLKREGLSLEEIDLIASHGQTLWHQVDLSSEVKSTLQNGESSIIMSRLGKTVVSDMRVADMAFGGQGAPLTSFLDVVLFATEGKTRAFQNLGGISNTTIITMKDGIVEAVAFDQGPANVLIDYAVRHYTKEESQYDKDGEMARKGTVNEALLKSLLEHPYYKQAIPKTTGRELFSDAYGADIIRRGEELGLSKEDIVATITQLTVDSVVRSYRDFHKGHIDEILVHGGGAFNPVIMEGFRVGLPGTNISQVSTENTGLPADCKEAVMFALIGHECIFGRPGQIPTCTGASQHTILGKITPGSNYLDLIKKVVKSGVQERDKTTQLKIIY
ncbi:Anhydro-N-acetylmuramic acid kinase [Smittium mucronatum]|uniref:Anhydro-N-acetylmuramic acid kinase n=1 Tax=Smittium mucronatum TaxID=133383 RepID=A0A1R0H5R8_9FUNG|nr:Anhydro-N-acetylmuramic acid kinase [Smittium mucronatum]